MKFVQKLRAVLAEMARNQGESHRLYGRTRHGVGPDGCVACTFTTNSHSMSSLTLVVGGSQSLDSWRGLNSMDLSEEKVDGRAACQHIVIR